MVKEQIAAIYRNAMLILTDAAKSVYFGADQERIPLAGFQIDVLYFDWLIDFNV